MITVILYRILTPELINENVGIFIVKILLLKVCSFKLTHLFRNGETPSFFIPLPPLHVLYQSEHIALAVYRIIMIRFTTDTANDIPNDALFLL